MKVANKFREIGLQSAILQPEYVSRFNESAILASGDTT